MKLKRLCIKNYRSIRDSGEIPLSSMHGFIGENNSGKSNIVRAIECLVSAGAGGISKDDFNAPSAKTIIKGVFDDLTKVEKKRWKSYLINEELILEKHIWIETDNRSDKETIKAEFHGYRAEPQKWFLSPSKIQQSKGDRPNWKQIVEDNGLPSYFLEDDKCNKTIFTKALSRYFEENDVEYDEPDLSTTQALGLQSNVVATLPSAYVLHAITDYSDEIDKRTSSSTFRRLMADLSERILKNDPRYQEIQTALDNIKSLLNAAKGEQSVTRLSSLSTIETRITSLLQKLMPSVQGISLSIAIEEIKDIFSRGITITVDDGIETDVLAKGHGLQRCIVFTLLQALILNERSLLVTSDRDIAKDFKPIILAIEEPELYIHPQLEKLFYDVMKEFSKTDQVLYTTHSPIFIDAFEYEKISIVRKPSTAIGTKIQSCETSAFEEIDERKIFNGLTKLNPAISEMFFARKVLLVEGPEDQIAVTTILQNEGVIVNRIEEIDLSIIVAGGKQSIPFFQRVLNAFTIPYTVLHDIDITSGMNPNDKATHEKTNKKISELAKDNSVICFPISLETSLGKNLHLKDQYEAHKFFLNTNNITKEVRNIIMKIFEKA